MHVHVQAQLDPKGAYDRTRRDGPRGQRSSLTHTTSPRRQHPCDLVGLLAQERIETRQTGLEVVTGPGERILDDELVDPCDRSGLGQLPYGLHVELSFGLDRRFVLGSDRGRRRFEGQPVLRFGAEQAEVGEQRQRGEVGHQAGRGDTQDDRGPPACREERTHQTPVATEAEVFARRAGEHAVSHSFCRGLDAGRLRGQLGKRAPKRLEEPSQRVPTLLEVGFGAQGRPLRGRQGFGIQVAGEETFIARVSAHDGLPWNKAARALRAACGARRTCAT